MKFKLTRSSDWREDTEASEIEINTLQELLDFIDNSHCSVILNGSVNSAIEIYDDYRE